MRDEMRSLRPVGFAELGYHFVVSSVAFGIPFLFMTSCSWMIYDNFQKFDDEFKNNRNVIARIVLDPQERRTEINSAYIIFERETSDK